MFNEKIHYFDWAMFNSYVSLPEGTKDRLKSVVGICFFDLEQFLVETLEDMNGTYCRFCIDFSHVNMCTSYTIENVISI